MPVDQSTARRVARDLLPPIVTRKYREMRQRRRDRENGVAGAGKPKGPLNPDLIEYGPDFYDEGFETMAFWKNPYYKLPWYPSWAVIADRIIHEPGAFVLDMGCGPGHLGRLLADRGVREYLGFDFSPKRLEQARTLVPEFHFEVADAYTTELFDTVGYSIVTCCEFLEHLSGDLEILARLRPKTRVLGTVPDYDATAHLRYFHSEDEVQARYSSLFDDLTVTRIRNPGGFSEWLLDGHRT